jgi:hypothetical protein
VCVGNKISRFDVILSHMLNKNIIMRLLILLMNDVSCGISVWVKALRY